MRTKFRVMMRYLFVVLAALMMLLDASAQTPAEKYMKQFEDVKGAKFINVKGGAIIFARPALKKYPIGAMSDSVNEISQLNMGKTSSSETQRFEKEMDALMKDYRYYGKSYTPEGAMDVYVHLKSDDVVDELVVYNPVKYILSSLIGIFPVEDLLKLYKGKTEQK